MNNNFLFKTENIFKLILKILFLTMLICFLSISFTASAKKKDEEKVCLYCNKYEKLKDWPESEGQKHLFTKKLIIQKKCSIKIIRQAD